jgi:hypothetical protein
MSSTAAEVKVVQSCKATVAREWIQNESEVVLLRYLLCPVTNFSMLQQETLTSTDKQPNARCQPNEELGSFEMRNIQYVTSLKNASSAATFSSLTHVPFRMQIHPQLQLHLTGNFILTINRSQCLSRHTKKTSLSL